MKKLPPQIDKLAILSINLPESLQLFLWDIDGMAVTGESILRRITRSSTGLQNLYKIKKYSALFSLSALPNAFLLHPKLS